MICHVREAIKPLVDELIVSVRDEQQRNRVFPYLPDGSNTFVYDELRDIGPLAGILPALRAARGEYVVIVACDMPFISTRAIELLFASAKGHDAAVPAGDDGFLAPLHAVNRREPMIRPVEESVRKGERRIAAPLKYLGDVVYVPAAEIRKVDPGLNTFLNVNRAEDLPK
jgi:molybdopterin-guanine dinucleotide biosynthesis protein A